MRRWIPPLLALVALGLVPWAIWLTTVLPSHEVAEHWDLAWGGLDLMLAGVLLATAVALWRGGPLLQATAASAATLLVVDAWFDLLTSSGENLVYAAVLAAVAELPLALLCLWIVHDAEAVAKHLESLFSAADGDGEGDEQARRDPAFQRLAGLPRAHEHD